jgi:hypothetical protein
MARDGADTALLDGLFRGFPFVVRVGRYEEDL